MTSGKQCPLGIGGLVLHCVHSRAMKLQQIYSAHEGATTSLSFHPSGNFLASGAGDSKVSVLPAPIIIVRLDLIFHLSEIMF